MPPSEEDDLPGSWHSLRVALRIARHAEPRLFLVACLIGVGSVLPEALFAVWLRQFAKGITDGEDSLIRAGAVGLAVSVVLAWILQIGGNRPMTLFTERATIAVEAHIAELQSTVGTIEHFERPGFMNNLTVLRDQVWRIVNIYGSTINTAGCLVRLLFTVALLAFIDPVLAVLVVFAVPLVLVSTRRSKAMRQGWLKMAPHGRLSRHMVDLAMSPSAAKEVRVTNAAGSLLAVRNREFEAGYAIDAHQRWVTAWWTMGAWAVFACGYGGALLYVTNRLEAAPYDVLLALAAGAALARYLTSTAGLAEELRFMLGATRQLAWLDDWVREHEQAGTAEPPVRLEDGVRVEHLSFAYPGGDELVLDDVSFHLPAGAIVAVVGENGAGKSTLVKLLCRLYEPTSGRIMVDGVDLADIRPERWRSRLSGAFQDHFAFELPVQLAVGVGELSLQHDADHVAGAVARGGADDLVAGLPDGLATQLGPQWPGGVQLSGGEWQKVALARGCMRTDPLVLVLDEPTASLDAETEHALFERFADAAGRSSRRGQITLLVSHRFSTVRMADLVIVLDGHKLAEMGSHDDLMQAGGLYAEIYTAQAAAYR
jgi:ATP-binding cassette subfamily B protein